MIWAIATSLTAQVAPAQVPTAAELARYDVNRNGVLDSDERAALGAERSRAAAAVAERDVSASGETVVLSPFEVVAETRGYQALNSISGTRFNTKLEDLGSSIEVVTKEQMSDFAMLDINDVFLYTGNTEGTGVYSVYDEAEKTGSTDDVTMQDPNNANRVRGLSSANIALSQAVPRLVGD